MNDSFIPSREAISYAVRELARRAGAPVETRGGETLVGGVPVVYGEPGKEGRGKAALFIVPCEPSAWKEILSLTEMALDRVPMREALPPTGRQALFAEDLPILFWGRGERRPFATRLPGGAVVLGADVIAATLFLLSRWEETVRTERDEHQRMPYTVSVAHRQGFLDRPVVDEYALVLREWIRALRPEWVPRMGSFSVKLSHDVDVMRPLASAVGGLRTVFGDLFRRKAPRQAARTGAALVSQTLWPRRTNTYRGLFRLAEISRRYKMSSAFYFMGAERSAQDSGYDPAWPFVRDAVERLSADGFELGFHPGYRTLNDPERLGAEKARVDRVLGTRRYGGRQHYLRFRVPDTWRDWERLGLSYDSTLTFAGHEGFRCGTSHAYRPFDLEEDRELGIEERPLVVMDGSLRSYRHLTPQEGIRRVLDLAEKCRRVEGTFTLLWHNSSFDGEWKDWGPAYEEMVAGLARLRDGLEPTFFAASTNTSRPESRVAGGGGVEELLRDPRHSRGQG